MIVALLPWLLAMAVGSTPLDDLGGYSLAEWEERLNNGSLNERRKAAIEILVMGERAAPLAGIVAKALPDGDSVVRERLAIALGKLEGPDSYTALLKLLATERQSRVQKAALQSLESLDPNGRLGRKHAQEVLPLLTRGLESRNQEVAKHFLRCAVRLGPPAAPSTKALLSFVACGAKELEELAKRAIEGIGADATPHLVEYFRVGQIDNARFFAALRLKENANLDGDQWLAVAEVALKDDSATIRDVATTTLVDVHGKTPLTEAHRRTLTAALTKSFTGPRRDTLAVGRKLLPFAQAGDNDVRAALVALSLRAEPELSRFGVEALANVGVAAIPDLVAVAEKGPTVEAQLQALSAVEAFAAEAVAVAPALLRLSKNPKNEVRRAAVLALAKADPSRVAEVLETLAEFISDDDPPDRQMFAMDHVARAPKLADAVRARLTKALRSEHPAVAARAFEVLVAKGQSAFAYRGLADMIVGIDASFARRAANLLHVLSDKEVDRYGASELGRMSIEISLVVLDDVTENPAKRVAALRTLARLSAEPRVKDALAKCIADADPSVRQAAAAVAEKLRGGAGETTVAALKLALTSDDPYCALAARRSLEKLGQGRAAPIKAEDFVTDDTDVVAVVTFRGVIDRILKRHNVADRVRKIAAQSVVRYLGSEMASMGDLLDRIEKVTFLNEGKSQIMVVQGDFADIYTFGKMPIANQAARMAFLDEHTVLVARGDAELDRAAKRVFKPGKPSAALAKLTGVFARPSLLSLAAVESDNAKLVGAFIQDSPSAVTVVIDAEVGIQAELAVYTKQTAYWKDLFKSVLDYIQKNAPEFLNGNAKVQVDPKQLIDACKQAKTDVQPDHVKLTIALPEEVAKGLAATFRAFYGEP